MEDRMVYSRLLRVFELGSLLVMLTLAGPAAAAEEAICSDPNVILCDNFNDRTITDDVRTSNFTQQVGPKTFGWGVDNTGGQGITNVGCLEGNCFFQNYPATPHGGDNGGGGFIGSPVFPQTRTFYYRFWIKYPANYVESVNGSKVVYGEGANGSLRQEMGSDRQGWPWVERGFVGGVEQRIRPNMNLGASGRRLGQWQCLEYRMTHESASGVNDGYWQAWVNDPAGGPDIQIAEYPNIRFQENDGWVSGTYYSDWLISAYWNCPGATFCQDPQNAHPDMTRLIDRVVVSKARIGCSGTASGTASASPSGSPPAPPGQVQAK
jgi:hypothetical protein